ncbi:hypothetical protein SNE35_02990 [Paucibacter sp. R3-3]|uniref:Uncharacterized protein n=1 Tax=Roseateles agri TaxID=3098619 RepID=A0ABU5DB23_9BURK|nr:hypothetical protein [Paucibacter sp. R3-3]MDY0743449.1 hypothetical protein [Paucibacter sp. R3-3]
MFSEARRRKMLRDRWIDSRGQKTFGLDSNDRRIEVPRDRVHVVAIEGSEEPSQDFDMGIHGGVVRSAMRSTGCA